MIVNNEINNLSEQLKYWRAERPDEWIMDDFIRKAEELEKAILEINDLATKPSTTSEGNRPDIIDIITAIKNLKLT